MKTTLLALSALMLAAAGQSSAGTVQGSSALALATLVGDRSPLLTSNAKIELNRLLAGRTGFPWPAQRKIEVNADSVVCRSSDVDITEHDCQLAFGKRTVTLNGRAAHELYATMIEAGVRSEGAAGSIYEGLSKLACTLDPHTIDQKGGGGANCTFTQGGP